MKRLLLTITIVTIIAILSNHRTVSAEEVSRGFEVMTISVEGVVIDILNDFKEKGVWMGIGQSDGQDRIGLGISSQSNDNLPPPTDQIQLFNAPYVARIAPSQAQAAKAQGYCVGNFESAMMYFDPKQIDSSGEAHILLACGPLAKFNCTPKCKIDVWAARWGDSTKIYGPVLYLDHYTKRGAKAGIKKIKKDLANAILEASESL